MSELDLSIEHSHTALVVENPMMDCKALAVLAMPHIILSRYRHHSLDIQIKQAHYRDPMKFNYMTKQVFNWHRTYLCGDGFSRLRVRGFLMNL